jgi:transposase InsO family protein
MQTTMDAPRGAAADASARPRYSGDPADKDIFLLRFEAYADRMEYATFYDGTVTHDGVPNDATTTAALAETTLPEKTWKRTLLKENQEHQSRAINAYNCVLDSLDPQTALTVRNEARTKTDPKACYDAMQRILNDTGVVTQMSLIVKLLMHIVHPDGTNPMQAMSDQSQIATKLEATGCVLPEPLLKAIVLFSLGPEQEHLRTKYIDAEETPGTPMALATLKNRLTTQFQVQHEAGDLMSTPANRASNQPPPSSALSALSPEAVLALNTFAQKMCIHCGGQHPSEKCWIKFPELRPKNPRRRGGGNGGGNGGATTSANNVTVPLFMLQYSQSSTPALGITPLETMKVVDSGCGVTVVPPNTPGLSALRPAVGGHSVKVADDKQLPVSHYATYTMSVGLQDGKVEEWHLPDCLVVPGVTTTLVATKHLNKLGYEVVLSDKGLGSRITTPQEKIALLGSAQGLPVIPPVDAAHLTADGGDAMLQHKRSMHFSKATKGVALDCNTCKATKQRNVTHYPTEVPEVPIEAFGDLVLSDVAGPFPPSLCSGNKYAVSFIDAHTGHLFVFYIKKKSQVKDAFKLFITYCKTHKYGDVRRIRTDRGGEYTDSILHDYEVATGIWHEWSAPRTPQQNGKAEVTWRTLKALTRAALYEAELHAAAWERAMSTAVYVHNRTDDDNGTCPYTLLTGKSVDRSGWRVFGCLAYALDKRYTRSLDSRAEVGVFMGYDPAGYVIYIPSRSRFLTTPAAKFDEGVCSRAGRHAAYAKHSKGSTKDLKIQVFSEDSDLAGLNQLDFFELPIESLQTPAPTAPASPAHPATGKRGSDALQAAMAPYLTAELFDEEDPARRAPLELRGLTSPLTNPHEDGSIASQQLMQDAADLPGRQTRQHTAFATLQRISDALAQPDAEGANAEAPVPPLADADLDRPAITPALTLVDLEGGLPAEAAEAGCQLVANDAPTPQEALASPEAPSWRECMTKEVKQLQKEAVEEVDRDSLPAGARVLPGKWVLKRKTVDPGDGTTSHDKFKGRYTARGDRQKKGRDFNTTWSPVIAFTILRLLIAFASTFGYPITQVDFDGAYLNALLDVVVFVEMPFGHSKPGKVWKLHRALYGLKQSGRLWYLTLKEWMEGYGFQVNPVDPCVFILHMGSSWIIAWVYVDDMGCFSNDEALKEQFLASLGARFAITNLGALQYYLGINIATHGRVVTLDQKKYIQEIAEKYKVEAVPVAAPVASKPSLDTTPLLDEEATLLRRMMGALVYIAVMTRPDISFAVSAASRHLHTPRVCDRVAIVRIYRYLLCTLHAVLTYSHPDSTIKLYTDSDFDNCEDTHRSQSGIAILMFGACLLWKSIRQAVVALSTTEAEYMAQCLGAQEALYLIYFLESLGIQDIYPLDAIILRGDNEGAIKMLMEGSDNSRTKHIDRKFYFLRELVHDGVFTPSHVNSQLNFADGLTKGLAKQLQKVSMARLLGLYLAN